MVSPRNYFLYTPLLPAVCTGTMEERSIVEPVRNLVRDKVRAADFKRKNWSSWLLRLVMQLRHRQRPAAAACTSLQWPGDRQRSGAAACRGQLPGYSIAGAAAVSGKSDFLQRISCLVPTRLCQPACVL